MSGPGLAMSGRQMSNVWKHDVGNVWSGNVWSGNVWKHDVVHVQCLPYLHTPHPKLHKQPNIL